MIKSLYYALIIILMIYLGLTIKCTKSTTRDLWKMLPAVAGFKFKEDENFNHRNTLSILRIALQLHYVPKFESDTEIGQKGAFCKGLKLTSRYRWICWHYTIYSVAIQLSTASASICHGSGWEFYLILRPCPAKSINYLSGVKKSDKLFISLWSLWTQATIESGREQNYNVTV